MIAIAITIFLIGLFAIELFTGLTPVIIAGFIISSACLVFCFFISSAYSVFCFFIDIAAPIVASLDKETFEKGFSKKYDEKVQKKVKKTARFWEIIYVILTLGNILLLIK